MCVIIQNDSTTMHHIVVVDGGILTEVISIYKPPIIVPATTAFDMGLSPFITVT